MSRTKNLEGQVFGKLKVIGDTGKRNEAGQQIVLTRHLETGELFETTVAELNIGSSTGYKKSDEGRNKSRDIMNRLNEDRNDYLEKKGYKYGTTTWAKNLKTPTNNTSGHKGVNKIKKSGRWRAYIFYKGKQIHLGVFQNIEEAIEARKAAEEKYFN